MPPLPEDITVLAAASPESPTTAAEIVRKTLGKEAPVAIDWEGGSDMSGGSTHSEDVFGGPGEFEDARSDGADGRSASSAPTDARVENGSVGHDDDNSDKSEISEQSAEAGSPPSVEKSFGRLTWDLCDRLRCEGCGNASPSPVHQCRDGHVLCSTCSRSLSVCPNKGCEEKIGSKDLPVNVALSAMADRAGATVPCRHKSCDWRVRHGDLARHEKYCVFIRKGLMSPTVTPTKNKKDPESPSKEELEEELSPDEILSNEIRSQLDCALCNHAAPAPVFQCRNGHVACYYCLGRLQQFDNPQCPLCSVPLDPSEKGGDGSGPVVRNAHLEGLASFAGTVVPCRYEGCGEEVRHGRLADHLKKCEHQPIKCIHCTVNADGSGSPRRKQERTYVNWDSMWEHYRKDHLPNYPPTSLDGIVVQSEMIKRMIDKKVDFVTWGHCLDPESGEPVRAFPGLFYDDKRDLFYFSVRIMGPINVGETCGLSVGPFATDPTDSANSHIRIEARMPPTSYRVGCFEDPDLGTAARTVRERPCLALSGPTVRCLLESSGGGEGGSLCFRVELPKSMM